jgi:threonyl-tRNA synthetase
MIKIELKDGSIREVEKGLSVLDIARGISEGLARVIVASEVNGKLTDLREIINQDITLNLLKFDDIKGKSAYWHTTSHVLAQAVKRLYPDVKLGIGPSIDNGFYYDFDIEKPFTPEQLTSMKQK